MLKTLSTLTVLLLSLSARADFVSATLYGLSLETGYKTAAIFPDKCQSADQIQIGDDSQSDTTILKCSGSIIGWVEVTLDAGKMYNLGNGSFNAFVGFSATGAPQFINIYTCDFTRDQDVAQDPSVTMSTDEEGNTRTLVNLMKRKAKFKAQLFYNENLESGKCLGKITEPSIR